MKTSQKRTKDVHQHLQQLSTLPPPLKVTLLHVDSDSGSASSHTFHVDHAVTSVTVHLAGVLKSSILTSPTGAPPTSRNMQ